VVKRKKHRKSGPLARAAILDAFTAHDLEVWATRSTDVQAYYDRVYYDLERQRAAHYDELCSALRAVPGIEVVVDRWVRVTDWRWNDTKIFARRAGLPPPPPRLIIKAPHELQKRLLTPPSVWRLEPQMFGIPATSQIFGRFIRDAGFDAILYPSQQGGETCLAVFPENFRASSSRIEVVGDVPPGASCTVLDKNRLCLGG
jgi:hypothetical protein